MKHSHWIYVALLSLVATPALAATGNINLFYGEKTLDSDWGVWDTQREYGLLIDTRGEGWPVSIAIDLFGSEDKESGITARTYEVDLGLRKVFNFTGPLHPYIGGGVAIIQADLDVPGTVIDDQGNGYWYGGGVFVTLGGSLNLGVDLRRSQADVDFGTSNSVNAGGDHVGVTLGFHF